MPEAPFIQQHATPKISLSVKILINKIWKSLQTFWTSHYPPNYSPFEHCYTRSRLRFTIQRCPERRSFRSSTPKWPVLEPCYARSRLRFTIQRFQNTSLQSVAFWGSIRFAQILVQFASKHGPRSKIRFLDPVTRFPDYNLQYSLALFNIFLFRVTFWTPSDGKTYWGNRVTWSKKWSQSKR